MPIPPNATGSHDRVRLRRSNLNNSITVHGTLLEYDPITGNIKLLMDYQPPNAEAILFTRGDAQPHYTDPAGLGWDLAS